jgi:SAM-dependent methyltransferase
MTEKNVKKEFDTLYSSSSCVWGLEADKYLAIHLNKAPRGYALDLGCGEGRHSLFLAQNGYTVDAVDISEKAIERLTSLSHTYGVESLVHPKTHDITHMNLPAHTYNLVVLSFVFPFMKRSTITALTRNVKQSLKPGGCIYISALTTDDIEYKTYAENQQPIEPRTYYSQGLQCYCYFFEKHELKHIFQDFDIIDYTEPIITLDREPYTHAMCLLFAKKVVV